MSSQITMEQLRYIIQLKNEKRKKKYSGYELESILKGFNFLFNVSGEDFSKVLQGNTDLLYGIKREIKTMKRSDMLYCDSEDL